MWDPGSPCEVRAGVALTDGEARRHVLDLEVVQHNRLQVALSVGRTVQRGELLLLDCETV